MLRFVTAEAVNEYRSVVVVVVVAVGRKAAVVAGRRREDGDSQVVGRSGSVCLYEGNNCEVGTVLGSGKKVRRCVCEYSQ